MSQKLLDILPAGVISGDHLQKLFQVAKENQFAIPAVNVVSSTSINAGLGECIKGQFLL